MIGVILLLAAMAGLIVGGALSLNRVDLTFETASLEALYDGTPLTKHECYLMKGTLKDGHRLEVEYMSSQTNVGESDNIVEVRIYDQLNADVTSDYNITYRFGKLKVNPREIEISSKSETKTYDGKPLSNNEYVLTSSQKGLVTGHRAVVSISGKITNAGYCGNTIQSVKILDDSNLDVTGNYKIVTKEGILCVEPIVLTIESESAMKVYDGKPLTADSYRLLNSLLADHQEYVEVSGSLTEVGTAQNTISSVMILGKYGQDVTENYRIILNEGVLNIVDKIEANEPGEGSGGGGGGGGGGSGGGDGEAKLVLYSVFANTSDALYLRIQSYGDYNGQTWEIAPKYDQLIDDKYAMSYLTSVALENLGAPAFHAEIVTHSQPYALPYYLSYRIGTIQTDDTVSSGDGKEGYSVDFYKYDEQVLSYNPINKNYEKEYRNFVRSNYLWLDDESRAYMSQIIAEQGFDKKDPDIINQVARYIQQAATYNLNFDPMLEESENIAIAFLDQYKEGVCRHYAAAATLLYRALGIPARYTEGAFVETVENQWVDVTPKQLHAWVEVYVNKIGWVFVEVTGAAPGASGPLVPGAGGGVAEGPFEGDEPGGENSGGENPGGENPGGEEPGGNETYPKKELTLTPKTVQKKYDGTALYPKAEISGFDDLARLGYTYQVTISGERVKVGVSESKIVDIRIFDSMGNDVTNSFNLTLNKGKIHVYWQILYFESPSFSCVYNGYSLESGHLVKGTLDEGSYYVTTSTADFNVGIQSNTFDIKVYSAGGEDITDQYYIHKTYGQVNVQPVQITLKAEDATKKYDGEPLTTSSVSLIEGQLLPGHQIVDVWTTGMQVEIGRSESSIERVIIKDASGVDVTANYAIECMPGKLRVTAS